MSWMNASSAMSIVATHLFTQPGIDEVYCKAGRLELLSISWLDVEHVHCIVNKYI